MPNRDNKEVDSRSQTRHDVEPERTRRLVRAPLSSSWGRTSGLNAVGFDGEQRFHKAVLFFTLLSAMLTVGAWLAYRVFMGEALPVVSFVPLVVCTGAGTFLIVAQRLGWRWASHLYTAIGFQIFVSGTVTYAQTLLPHGMELRMVDASVAAWIVFFATFVAMPPKATGIGAFGSAVLVPVLPLLLTPHHFQSAASLVFLGIWSVPSFGMATWVIWLSKRHDQLVREAQDAKELGSYRLIHQIGHGGMGEVWQARHHTLARDAAVKLVRAKSMGAVSGHSLEVAKERFRREATIIASLRSPHTVQLYDFGTTLDESFYYVMELLPGMDLQQMVRHFGPLPPGRVISFLKQACRSLAEAHNTGVIHRDIKPSNLFVSRLGMEADFLKVLDFGLARRDTPGMQQLTAAGSLTGTPAYLAPELLRDVKAADARADIYALGCVGYFLLTGTPVFEGETLMAVALAHLQEEPCPPSIRVERMVPEDLEAVIMRCLSKEPDKRYQNAADLEQALDACASASEWTENLAQEWWDLHGTRNETPALVSA